MSNQPKERSTDRKSDLSLWDKLLLVGLGFVSASTSVLVFVAILMFWRSF